MEQMTLWDIIAEPLAATEGKTSKPSSKRFVKSGGAETILYLCLRQDGGNLLGASWETVGALPGASWTPLAGAYPSVERESFLWQILQENAPPKYFLTRTACMGILRRAEKRGKELPPMLKEALEEVVGGGGTVQCLNPWDCESKRQYAIDGVYRTLDAGNGAGGQAHGVCYPMGCDLYNGTITGEKSATIGANSCASANHAGTSILQPAAFMGGQGAKAGSIAYADDGSTPTIKSAPSGGNTVPDVVYPINTMVATRGGKDDGRTTFGVGEANDPQFTLGAAHEHAVCYAIEGNVVDREAKQNGMGVSRDQSPTLNGQDKHAVCFQQDQREEVRDMGGASGALSAESGSHQQNYVCYAPKANFCGTFEESEKAATLQTGYHYGSGGDAAMMVYRQDGFAGYTDGVGTLKASGGDVGACSESILVQPRIYDARGNGDGETIPTLTGDHENRITDYTALCVERKVDG